MDNSSEVAAGGEVLGMQDSAETAALVKIQKALRPLDLNSRREVLAWFTHKYASSEVLENGAGARGRRFEDLPSLFEAVGPKSRTDKVLTVAYYHTQILGETDVDVRTVTRELKQIGQPADHVSQLVTSLNRRNPSYLVMSATSSRIRRYRVTSAGTKYVTGLMARIE